MSKITVACVKNRDRFDIIGFLSLFANISNIHFQSHNLHYHNHHD